MVKTVEGTSLTMKVSRWTQEPSFYFPDRPGGEYVDSNLKDKDTVKENAAGQRASPCSSCLLLLVAPSAS